MCNWSTAVASICDEFMIEDPTHCWIGIADRDIYSCIPSRLAAILTTRRDDNLSSMAAFTFFVSEVDKSLTLHAYMLVWGTLLWIHDSFDRFGIVVPRSHASDLL